VSVVVGFDTALTISGCARVDLGIGGSGQLEAIRWETWRARTPQPDMYTVLHTRRRIRIMLREILALVPDRFDLAVVEGPSMRSKHTPLADERSGLRWMLVDQLLARGEVVLVPPTTRAILGAGSGNADKQAVLAAVRDMVPAANVPDANVADAVALALAGAHSLGMPWPVDMTAKQVSAHAKVAWPMGLVGASAGQKG
jgi:hypothetical protein